MKLPKKKSAARSSFHPKETHSGNEPANKLLHHSILKQPLSQSLVILSSHGPKM
jgi:hypothetical protein